MREIWDWAVAHERICRSINEIAKSLVAVSKPKDEIVSALEEIVLECNPGSTKSERVHLSREIVLSWD